MIVAVVSLRLRSEIREQIIGRDAEILAPVITQRLERAQHEFRETDPAVRDTNVLAVILEAAELRNVVAVRYFNREGELLEAVPMRFLRGGIDRDAWDLLEADRPISRYHSGVSLDRFFYSPDGTSDQSLHTLLAVLIPVRATGNGELFGAAEFLVDGTGLQGEFRELDRSLIRQALIAFAAGALIISGTALWGFRRLDRSQRLLADRSRRLLEANRELTLRARTSAIGAVTAHLMHELKNSVSGLREYVSGHGESDSESAADETALANELTRRMQDRIQEVLAFLREEENGEVFEFDIEDLLELLRKRLGEPARSRGVELRVSPAPDVTLDNRTGNLLLLALENLVQNAVEATPAGKAVRITVRLEDRKLVIGVVDAGPGLSTERAADPFRPRPSAKPGGGGIGLMLSRELSGQIGAELHLAETGPEGTEFRLTLELPSRNPPSA